MVGTVEVAVQKRITGNFQIPMQAAYWSDELCAERRLDAISSREEGPIDQGPEAKLTFFSSLQGEVNMHQVLVSRGLSPARGCGTPYHGQLNMDSAQSRPLHRWTFRDRPNGNSEDAEARKTVDTFQWAHSELTGSLMHGHENRARYAKAEDEEMRRPSRIALPPESYGVVAVRSPQKEGEETGNISPLLYLSMCSIG
ncbi:hypothetical protein A7C99_5258 [Trichophyton rubrum]|uniref:Uncharacterized protein n=1 Tax=Trichophyton rubrum TaxID=5551 RepID=A0A178ES78_TRIRU|nr:hypothetical protein A7C99_5258 [Trichophyton rubrum]